MTIAEMLVRNARMYPTRFPAKVVRLISKPLTWDMRPASRQSNSRHASSSMICITFTGILFLIMLSRS